MGDKCSTFSRKIHGIWWQYSVALSRFFVPKPTVNPACQWRTKDCCFSRVFQKYRCDHQNLDFILNPQVFVYMFGPSFDDHKRQLNHLFPLLNIPWYFLDKYTVPTLKKKSLIANKEIWLLTFSLPTFFKIYIYMFSSYFGRSCILLSWDSLKMLRKNIGSSHHQFVGIGRIKL